MRFNDDETSTIAWMREEMDRFMPNAHPTDAELAEALHVFTEMGTAEALEYVFKAKIDAANMRMATPGGRAALAFLFDGFVRWYQSRWGDEVDSAPRLHKWMIIREAEEWGVLLDEPGSEVLAVMFFDAIEHAQEFAELGRSGASERRLAEYIEQHCPFGARLRVADDPLRRSRLPPGAISRLS